MLTKSEMMPLLIEACSSFVPVWQHMEAERGEEDHLLYVELGCFASHLVNLHIQEQTSEFAAVFALVERFHTEGDEAVRNAATIGLLEGIQNIAGNSGLDGEVFVSYLHPVSAAWWRGLNRFWSGESLRVTLHKTDLF